MIPQRFVALNDKPTDDIKDNDDKVVKEVYASKTREAIDAIIKCIDDQRAKGNKVFTTDGYVHLKMPGTIDYVALDAVALGNVSPRR